MAAGFFRRFTKRFFMFCNIVAAVLFLLGCYGSALNPQYFWFIGLLTLASLYLLLVLLIFIVFWFIAKAKYVWISFAAIFLAWVPLGRLIKLHTGTETMTAKHPGTLRVMSWNVEHFDILEHKTHPEVKGKMMALVNNYEPDIACFQEMVASDDAPAAINYLPGFLMQMQFANYHYSYNSKLDFDDDHHFGIIIFSRYPIIDKHTVSYEPNDYNSIFQYVDILKGSDTFRVFNIHLQSLKFSDVNKKYLDDPSMKSEIDLEKSKSIISKLKQGFLKRKLQSERIKDYMDKSPYPVIVCGDFNDVPNSYAYNTIGKKMNNAFAEEGSGIGRTFSGISPTLRIDNIFCDKRFEVEQFVRVKRKLSDHFPIIADLNFEK